MNLSNYKRLVRVGWIGSLLLLSFVAARALYDRLYRHGGVTATVFWVDGPSTPSDRFMAVAFPRTEDVRLMPRASGDGPKVLHRALLVAVSEFGEKRISVWQDNAQYTVGRNDLTFVPPRNDQDLVAQLNQAIVGWGSQTDWRRVDLRRLPEDSSVLQLDVYDHRGRAIRFRYSVNPDRPTDVQPLPR